MRAARLAAFALLSTPGCIAVTVPGHAPMGTFTPLSPEAAPTGAVFGEAAFWPTAGGNLRLPVSDEQVVDLGGQVSLTSYALTPGLWLREPGTKNDGKGEIRVAHRVGLEGGQGDLLGLLPYDMPFVGASYHIQTSRQRRTHVASSTIGLSLAAPFDLGETANDENGDGVIVITWPCAWVSGRWAWAWPVGESGDQVVLAAGFDLEVGIVGLSLLVVPIVPSPTLGLAWQFGPPRNTKYTPPSETTD